jgi:hypothetical protein
MIRQGELRYLLAAAELARTKEIPGSYLAAALARNKVGHHRVWVALGYQELPAKESPSARVLQDQPGVRPGRRSSGSRRR